MIYFIRHGSTDWNENKDELGNINPKCQGRVDIPLNELGIAQAKKAAETLKGKHFDRVICSPLKRAKQTCDIVYQGNTPVEIDERLTERDFGEFEGKTRTEFDFYGFWNANANQKFEKAESIEDVKTRVMDLVRELAKNPEQDILLVSHGGVGCVLMSIFKGVPASGDYLTFEIPNGKPLELDLTNK